MKRAAFALMMVLSFGTASLALAADYGQSATASCDRISQDAAAADTTLTVASDSTDSAEGASAE